MSRHTTIINHPGGIPSYLNYGWDHALGFWIDELQNPIDDEEDICLWEASETIDGIGEVISKFKEFEEFIPPRFYNAFMRKEPF